MTLTLLMSPMFKKTAHVVSVLAMLFGFGTMAHAGNLIDTQLAVEAGAGYASFAQGPVANATNGGLGWDMRLVFGAHSPIGLELGYVGTSNALAGVSNFTLMSNAFEGDLRLGTPTFGLIPVQAYGFGGAGVNRFSLVHSGVNTTTITDGDTTAEVPAGAGLQFNLSDHVALDTRFTYRFMFDQQVTDRRDNADMYTITARIGFVL